MKFNMGCGRRKLDGYVNVDAVPAAEPDEVWDLEQFPWPWPDNCATEVRFIHSLEHMGGDPKVFLKIMQELYRIAAPGCEIVIHVPHHRHDNFVSDPTHVRAITADTLRLFDRKLNDEWLEKGGANSPLAHYLTIDFELVEEGISLDEPYWAMFQSGGITSSDVEALLKERNNVARESRFVLRARKP